MTPQEVEKMIDEKIALHVKRDRYLFDKVAQFLDGRNIRTGLATGTSLGESAEQKAGLHGSASVQALKINDVSGGAVVDAEARTAIAFIIDALETHGITSTT